MPPVGVYFLFSSVFFRNLLAMNARSSADFLLSPSLTGFLSSRHCLNRLTFICFPSSRPTGQGYVSRPPEQKLSQPNRTRYSSKHIALITSLTCLHLKIRCSPSSSYLLHITHLVSSSMPLLSFSPDSSASQHYCEQVSTWSVCSNCISSTIGIIPCTQGWFLLLFLLSNSQLAKHVIYFEPAVAAFQVNVNYSSHLQNVVFKCNWLGCTSSWSEGKFRDAKQYIVHWENVRQAQLVQKHPPAKRTPSCKAEGFWF